MVDRTLEAHGPSKYERKLARSNFGAYAPRVRALLALTPTTQASVLAEQTGWTGSASLFRDKVRAIRPEYLPADPVGRLVHEPGQAMQCDLWFPHETGPVAVMSFDTATKELVTRSPATGKSNREIRRNFKRYVCRAIFRQLQTIMA